MPIAEMSQEANSKYFVHNFCTGRKLSLRSFVSAQLLRHDGLFGHGSERDREKNKGEGRKDKKKDGRQKKPW